MSRLQPRAPPDPSAPWEERPILRIKALPINTFRENVVVLARGNTTLRPERLIGHGELADQLEHAPDDAGRAQILNSLRQALKGLAAA